MDFTLLPEAPYSEQSILEQLQALARSAAEMSGFELPTELIRVLPRHNKAGQDTFQGRLYYRPHKDKTGWDCPGRIGYWVDTIYLAVAVQREQVSAVGKKVMKAKSSSSVQTKKARHMSDKAFADLKEALEGALAFERGEQRDLHVIRIRAPRAKPVSPKVRQKWKPDRMA